MHITLSEIAFASSFIFTDDSLPPVLLGKKSDLYYQGVTDGFILRDATDTCMEIKVD